MPKGAALGTRLPNAGTPATIQDTRSDPAPLEPLRKPKRFTLAIELGNDFMF